MKKIKEWLNIQYVKNPGQTMLCAILLFNILFFILSSLIISGLSLTGTEKMGFFEAAFCTITMILDAGCIQFVVSDIGTAGVATVVLCLAIVIIGMITFTGAVVGYMTNYISAFIENANSGAKKLKISGHSVILNWNTRASEIVNDLLYCDTPQKVVVLVNSRKQEIEKEIQERLSATVSKENDIIARKYAHMSFIKRKYFTHKNMFKKHVTVIVREGDIFSSKQLKDISIEHAKMIIILGNDINNTICKFEHKEKIDRTLDGNSQTVKTLMQVADITSAEYSDDNQKIVVEITDSWTAALVDKIIKAKEVEQKCNIVPVNVDQVLGHILSQFSLMPELNRVYYELFSNKGESFYTREFTTSDDEELFIRKFLETHEHALPLTFMNDGKKNHFYYVSENESDMDIESEVHTTTAKIKIKPDYWIECKNVVILGHNSRCNDIMNGFAGFNAEWKYKDSSDQIINLLVIDDEKHLEKANYYKGYPFNIKCKAAEIYEKETIINTVSDFISSNEEDTSILILSDDMALNEDIDANALANLIYVRDIINHMKEENPDFNEESVDVVVEIIDPKHHDIINSYSINNVVISNRYISKMITQIGEKEALFDFYCDILTYDEEDSENGISYESKEIYIKKVSRFLEEVPPKMTAKEFVDALYYASVDPSIPKDQQNPTIVLGYVKPGQEMVLFKGDLAKIEVELDIKDKLVVFTNH